MCSQACKEIFKNIYFIFKYYLKTCLSQQTHWSLIIVACQPSLLIQEMKYLAESQPMKWGKMTPAQKDIQL